MRAVERLHGVRIRVAFRLHKAPRMLRMVFVLLAFAQTSKADLSPVEDASSAALQRGDYQRVLTLTEQGLAQVPNDAWLLYDRGAALASLNRLDEAVAVLQRAQATFKADEPWGRALASYRRGLALARLGRCGEANLAIAQYASLMRQMNHEVAADAQSSVAQCERQNVSGRAQ
jgi:tetratricopeptide (TPR) repeat protein